MKYKHLVLKQNVKDHYYHRAKKENFAARSVYKLQHIQERYQVLKKGQRVLDLGAAPGSWSEFVALKIGRQGHLVAIDQRPLAQRAMSMIDKSACQFEFIEASVMDELPEGLGKFEVVLSDLAPWTAGTKFLDSFRALELVQRAFDIAQAQLAPGGSLIVKLFQSEDSMALAKIWKKRFRLGKLYKPPSTHKESKEIYFVGCGLSA